MVQVITERSYPFLRGVKVLMTLLKTLNAEGRTILMVTHEPEIAAMAKRQIYMKDGVVAGHEIFRG